MLSVGEKRKSYYNFNDLKRSKKSCLPEILEIPKIDIGPNAKLETATSAEILSQANRMKDLCNKMKNVEIKAIGS
jgi:hypothetical protein